MRIVIVSDAGPPQVNGVVRTLGELARRLRTLGHEVTMIGPSDFRTVPMPSYPEIRLAVAPGRRLGRIIDATHPAAIHIATEGPLGLAARKYCLVRGYPFTTAYHTRFPEYVQPRFRVPISWSYAMLRWFHGPAQRIMVATDSIEQSLAARGFRNIARWTRGVDTEMFHPGARAELPWPRPVQLYVGRVAIEKNIEAFLKLDVPGTKVVVGDGPSRKALERAYPAAQFLGPKSDADLVRLYASADVFVFPSRTDTFGLVLLEALACGLPVAAYPVAGPLDVIGTADAGVLHEDLGEAVRTALTIPADRCRAHALRFSWDESVRQFLANIEAIPDLRAAS